MVLFDEGGCGVRGAHGGGAAPFPFSHTSQTPMAWRAERGQGGGGGGGGALVVQETPRIAALETPRAVHQQPHDGALRGGGGSHGGVLVQETPRPAGARGNLMRDLGGSAALVEESPLRIAHRRP